MRKTRTTVHLEDKDKEAISIIREYYGLSSNDDAIRLALREVARRLLSETSPSAASPKQGLGIPPHG